MANNKVRIGKAIESNFPTALAENQGIYFVFNDAKTKMTDIRVIGKNGDDYSIMDWIIADSEDESDERTWSIDKIKELADKKVDIEENKSLVADDEIAKLESVEEGAQKNVQTDWNQNDDEKDDFLKNKPKQTNFNIYNQNINDEITVSDTSETSIIRATTGITAVPSYNETDSYIGAIYGTFNPNGSNQNLQLFFQIGNRTQSLTVNSSDENSNIPFSINYVINFYENRKANLSGILTIGDNNFIINLNFSDNITGLTLDFRAKLQGGELVSRSSYLHRNYNLQL